MNSLIRLFILFNFSFLFFSCKEGKSAPDKFSDELINQAAKELKCENLKVFGTGGGIKNDKINLIGIRFNYPHCMDMCTARKLIVKVATTLEDLINKKDDENKYFENSPVDPKIFDIAIFGSDSELTHSQCICIVSIIKNKVIYYVNNSDYVNKKEPPLLTFHKETIQEAKRIVESKATM